MKPIRDGAVTERALFARIRRALLKASELLHRCREGRWFGDTGRYAATDFNKHVTRTHIDLEALGRELGVLQSGERVLDTSCND